MLCVGHMSNYLNLICPSSWCKLWADDMLGWRKQPCFFFFQQQVFSLYLVKLWETGKFQVEQWHNLVWWLLRKKTWTVIQFTPKSIGMLTVWVWAYLHLISLEVQWPNWFWYSGYLSVLSHKTPSVLSFSQKNWNRYNTDAAVTGLCISKAAVESMRFCKMGCTQFTCVCDPSLLLKWHFIAQFIRLAASSLFLMRYCVHGHDLNHSTLEDLVIGLRTDLFIHISYWISAHQRCALKKSFHNLLPAQHREKTSEPLMWWDVVSTEEEEEERGIYDTVILFQAQCAAPAAENI